MKKNFHIKYLITFIFAILCTYFSYSNMASPIIEGSISSTPFISDNVDIIKEKMVITPDANFETATYQIEYYIDVHESGEQIPLLFYAKDYKSDFVVYLDGKQIELNSIPSALDRLDKIENTPMNGFTTLPYKENSVGSLIVNIQFSSTGRYSVLLNDLKYFHTDLSEGKHVIKVAYKATSWVDNSDWVKSYSFRYSLSPAKYWKSFGELEVMIDNRQFQKPLTTNMETTLIDSSNHYLMRFQSLPSDVLIIYYHPEIDENAKFIINFSPSNIANTVGALLFIIHILLMVLFRKIKRNNKISWVMIAGSIIFPFLALLSYELSFSYIDDLIGDEASKSHGYTFFVFVMYPVILIPYWILMWLVDEMLKKIYSQKKQSE